MDAIYLRKSRLDLDAEKSGEGNTLLRHKNALLELARRQKRQIGEIYEEVRSGETIASRPEMQRLLQDVEAGRWDAVLVVEIERLARGDSIDQGIVAQTFRLSGTKIITPLKTYDPVDEYDEQFMEFGLFMSRQEYKAIKRRMAAGRIAAVKEGKFVGKTPPYGYRRERCENGKGWTLRIEPTEAEVVRRIYAMHTELNYGFQKIARTLNNEHIPAAKGGAWAAYTVRTVLDNVTYAGMVYWGKRPVVKAVRRDAATHYHRPAAKDYLICKGLHEAIISMEIYEKSQSRRQTHKGIPVRNDTGLANPLQGILFCKKCGHMMQLNSRPGKTPSLFCRNLACDAISARLPVVEDALLSALSEWLVQYKVEVGGAGYAAQLKERIANAQQMQQQAQQRLKQLDNKLSRVYDMLEDGIYTVDEFNQRREYLLQSKTEQGKSFDAAKADEQDASALLQRQEEIIPQVERLLSAYTKSDCIKEKNDMLKSVLVKIEYLKTKKYDDKTIKLWIYPRLNAK